MIIKIVLMFFGVMGLLNAQASAQLYIEQAKVVLSVSGGEHTDGAILIHNTSAEPLSIRVYWEDFEYKAPYDGTKNFLPAGTVAGSASQWVSFSPQEFIIPGFGQQKVDYTVTVPSMIQEGHYGVLFFERSNLSKIDNNEVNIVSRIGTLFFIEPSNKAKKAVIQDISLNEKGVAFSFVNQGNVILIPNTTYYIMQTGGLVLSRGEAKKVYVPPGASASLVIPLKKELASGQYTLVVNSDLDEGDVVVKEIGLNVDASGQITIGNTQD